MGIIDNDIVRLASVDRLEAARHIAETLDPTVILLVSFVSRCCRSRRGRVVDIKLAGNLVVKDKSVWWSIFSLASLPVYECYLGVHAGLFVYHMSFFVRPPQTG